MSEVCTETYAVPSGRVKKCAKCGEKQSVENFGAHASSGDGRQSYCKTCKNGLHKKKRTNDSAFRLKHHFATRVADQLGENCPDHMYRDLETLIGYTFKTLRKHLNQDIKNKIEQGLIKPEEKIKWAKDALNQGWHVDHIRPLHSFNCKTLAREEDLANFRACWAMENLEMLRAADNLAKGGKVD